MLVRLSCALLGSTFYLLSQELENKAGNVIKADNLPITLATIL